MLLHTESIHHIIIEKEGKNERRRKKVPELSKGRRGEKYPAQKYHRIADDGKRSMFCSVYWINCESRELHGKGKRHTQKR